MNYKIYGRNNQLFGPYTPEEIENFIKAGKVKEDMVLVDEGGTKHFAVDVFPSSKTIDLTYLSDEKPIQPKNSPKTKPTKEDLDLDYVSLGDPSDDYIVFRVKDSSKNLLKNPIIWLAITIILLGIIGNFVKG